MLHSRVSSRILISNSACRLVRVLSSVWVETENQVETKLSRTFVYLYFIIEIIGNENGSGINGIVKTNGNGNTNKLVI